jgi:hypothetical protein
MGHFGIKLESDFSDYYDADMCSTPYAKEFLFKRLLSERADYPSQLSILKQAGLPVPKYGQLSQIIQKHTKALGVLANIGGANELFDILVFIENKLKKISLRDAKKLDPDTFACEYIPANPMGVGHIVRYVHLGDTGVWLDVFSAEDTWKVGYNNNVNIQLISKSSRIKPEFLRHFNNPLFSIDFIKIKDELLSVGYHNAPNLKNMGLEAHLSADSVSSHIIRGIII